MTPGPDHWERLGLRPGASAAEVHAARRQLAKRAHPDAGGTAAEMQAINAAAAAALADLARRPQPRSGPRQPPRPHPRGPQHLRWAGVGVDHPSFVIEALPDQAFEWLRIAAAELGDLIDEDPPQRLEVALRGDVRGWCELTLTVDGGVSSVSLAVAAEPGLPRPSVEVVRDAWVTALNAI